MSILTHKKNIENYPPRFRNCTFDNYITNKGNVTAYEYVKNSNKNQETGFMLSGNCGTGKTHLLYAFARQNNVFVNYIIHNSEFLNNLKAEFKNNENEVLDYYSSTPVLFIDDFGVEKTTEWALEQIYLLLNRRYINCLPIFLTTNLSISELEQKFGKRIVSRLFEMVKFLKIESFDYRKKNGLNKR